MAELKKYLPEEAMRAVSVLREQFALLKLDPTQSGEMLRPTLFRDAGGIYHAIGIKTKQWYRFEAGTWSVSGPPLDRLEGEAVLDTYLSLEIPGAPAEPPIGPSNTPVTAFVNLITRWGKDYHMGRFDSDTVEEAVRDVVLMDRQGRFWTVGLQSGRWYSFFQDRWHPASGPPDASTLFETLQAPPDCPSCHRTIDGDKYCRYCGQPVPRVRTVIPDELNDAVLSFLEYGSGTLPEPVTAQWNPPDLYPEMPVSCPFCSLVHVEQVRQCDRCGTELDPTGQPLCSQCGTELATGVKFCRQCGHPVQPSPGETAKQEPRVCPNPKCGRTIPSGKKFCTACGTRITLQ